MANSYNIVEQILKNDYRDFSPNRRPILSSCFWYLYTVSPGVCSPIAVSEMICHTALPRPVVTCSIFNISKEQSSSTDHRLVRKVESFLIFSALETSGLCSGSQCTRIDSSTGCNTRSGQRPLEIIKTATSTTLVSWSSSHPAILAVLHLSCTSCQRAKRCSSVTSTYKASNYISVPERHVKGVLEQDTNPPTHPPTQPTTVNTWIHVWWVNTNQKGKE